ncbi:TonB family protein [Pedobacter sp. ASV1-7]|uniref:TonB family protein n=1 Tax=Pedobacter sp. ASV1-7 TaxID=3145237 RepID=UPI0032E8539A
MAIKNLLSLFILVGTLNCALAQKKQITYFYKNNNKRVSSIDSADFVRIIQEPDSGSAYFKLIEAYPDGKIKTRGSLSSYPPLKLEDQYISYYRNGKRKKMTTYKNNVINGSIYYYFENGSLNKIVELSKNNLNNNPFGKDTLIMHQADSTGRIMIQDGNGRVTTNISSYGGAILDGEYKNGLKHGMWTMKSNDGILSYREEYLDGKFITGESEVKGIKSRYTSIYQPASFKGGIENFYNYIKRSLSYPKDAQKNEIQGKVFLRFDIDTDGSLINIEVTRKLYPSLDAEALSVIEDSPKWIPAKIHGLPVKMKFNVPISFSLHNEHSQFPPENNFNNRRGF